MESVQNGQVIQRGNHELTGPNGGNQAELASGDDQVSRTDMWKVLLAARPQKYGV